MGGLLESSHVAPLFPFFGQNFLYIYIWNLFDLCLYFPIGCHAKAIKQFRMGSKIGELVGPTRGRESCIG